MTTIEVVTERPELVRSGWGYVYAPGGSKVRATGIYMACEWQNVRDQAMVMVTGDFRLIVCRPEFVS